MAKDYDDDDDRDRFSERRGREGRISRRRDDDDAYDRDNDDYSRRRRRDSLEPHRGSTVLVLGILSLVACGPLGIAAWIMGSADLKSIAEGRMDPTGEGMTRAGYILGIVATILMGVGLLFVILWSTVVVTMLRRQ